MNEEKVKKWIVRVLATQDSEEVEGTGFWAAKDGYVLTCDHVVANLPELWVAYGEDKAQASIVEREGDIALLHVEGMSGEVAPLDQYYQIGDAIYSLGYQYEGVHGKFTLDYFPIRGKIYGESKIDNQETIVLEKAYHVRPGASGAPVLNCQTGNVVGIIRAKWEQKDREMESQFALPLTQIYGKWKVLAPSFQEKASPVTPLKIMETFRALVTPPLLTPRWNGAPNPPAIRVGRDDQMHAITDFWQAAEKRVLGLVGLGGIGKSTLIRAWCESAQGQGINWDGLFWWNAQAGESFPSFLSELCSYLTGYKPEALGRIPPETMGKIHAASEMLGAGRFLLVLDGFEELQIIDKMSTDFGSLKDSEIREFLRLILNPALHNSRCLIASRVPLTELQTYNAFQQMDINRLSTGEGMTLLQERGVSGDPEIMAEIVETYQGHPLTLFLFGTILKKYKQGDILKAKDIPQPVSNEKYYRPLHTVLRYYDEQLSQEEQVFLNIFAAVRTPVNDEMLKSIFHGQDEGEILAPELKALDDFAFIDLVDGLLQLRLLNKHNDIMEGDFYTIHSLIRDFYYSHLSSEYRKRLEGHLSSYYLVKASQAKNLKDFIESESEIPLPPFGRVSLDNKAYSTDAREPLIMATHHACKAEDYDKAYEIYYYGVQEGDWTLTRQLGAFETDLWLVRQFFPQENLEGLPLVSKSADQSTLINQAGYCLKELGRPSDAENFFRRACQLDREGGLFSRVFEDYLNLVEVLVQTGHLEDAGQSAEAMQEISLKLASQEDFQESEVILRREQTLVNKAWIAHLKGKTKKSGKLFRESKKLAKLLQPEVEHLFSMPGIFHATHLLTTGNLRQAAAVNTWNLQVCENAGFIQNIAACRRLQGDMARLRGDLKSAGDWCNSAMELVWQIGLRSEIVQALIAFGLLHLAEGNYPKSNNNLTMALEIASEAKYRLFEADVHVALGRLKAAQEDFAGAVQHLEIALSLAEDTDYYWAKAGAEQMLAEINV